MPIRKRRSHNFKRGDFVIIREDLTREEKNTHPQFVDTMEPTVGHVYQLGSDPYNNGLTSTIRRCELDPMAPSPDSFMWHTLWFRPFEEEIKCTFKTTDISSLI